MSDSSTPPPPVSSPARSRRFVVAFVLVALALAVLATLVITRGWNDPAIQDWVREREAAEER